MPKRPRRIAAETTPMPAGLASAASRTAPVASAPDASSMGARASFLAGCGLSVVSVGGHVFAHTHIHTCIIFYVYTYMYIYACMHTCLLLFQKMLVILQAPTASPSMKLFARAVRQAPSNSGSRVAMPKEKPPRMKAAAPWKIVELEKAT